MEVVSSFRIANACIDENTAEHVIQALWSNSFLDPSRISVAVVAGQVMLSGTVETEQEAGIVREVLDDLHCCADAITNLKVASRPAISLSTAA